jgi:hypothetical protein
MRGELQRTRQSGRGYLSLIVSDTKTRIFLIGQNAIGLCRGAKPGNIRGDKIVQPQALSEFPNLPAFHSIDLQ